MTIHFVTGNRNKLREFEKILGLKLNHVNLDLDEIQAVEVEKVVFHKTKQAFCFLKKPVITEDTGLYFEDWNGLPGALVKLFEKNIGYKNLCGLLGKNRKAKAQTVIGYYDGRAYKRFIGEIKGKIAGRPKGRNDFGWDVIFIPEGSKRTFAQMSEDEKNEISMRRKALEKFKKAGIIN